MRRRRKPDLSPARLSPLIRGSRGCTRTRQVRRPAPAASRPVNARSGSREHKPPQYRARVRPSVSHVTRLRRTAGRACTKLIAGERHASAAARHVSAASTAPCRVICVVLPMFPAAQSRSLHSTGGARSSGNSRSRNRASIAPTARGSPTVTTIVRVDEGATMTSSSVALRTGIGVGRFCDRRATDICAI